MRDCGWAHARIWRICFIGNGRKKNNTILWTDPFTFTKKCPARHQFEASLAYPEELLLICGWQGQLIIGAIE